MKNKNLNDFCFGITLGLFPITSILIGMALAFADFKAAIVLGLFNLVSVVIMNKYIKDEKKARIEAIIEGLKNHFYSSGVNAEATFDIECVEKIIKEHK